MSVFQGDFLGFQLGDEHSYNLNITRVTMNDRYTDTLTPSFNDTTVQVPGGHGLYYFGTQYTQKTFQIDFAFDNLDEVDLRRLRRLFTFEDIKPLIFDEFPYKKYMVRCQQPPALTYIPFGFNDHTIYKGEGTATFITYYPFALGTEEKILTFTSQSSYAISNTLINNGDLPADIIFKYNNPMYRQADPDEFFINILLTDESGNTLKTLRLDFTAPSSAYQYLVINSKTNLINYEAGDGKMGAILNQYIIQGDFFKIPLGKTYIRTSISSNGTTFTSLVPEKVSFIPVFY